MTDFPREIFKLWETMTRIELRLKFSLTIMIKIVSRKKTNTINSILYRVKIIYLRENSIFHFRNITSVDLLILLGNHFYY